MTKSTPSLAIQYTKVVYNTHITPLKNCILTELTTEKNYLRSLLLNI